ncbi:helix-turn-helix domain-containing protein [Ferrimicrobium acidiphilum]|uniref:helix-turn-helix domain-containing protein n=1 Tax=Ferrimicrobium acidiphilum TaxID=121039 RepID=UPI003C6D45AB
MLGVRRSTAYETIAEGTFPAPSIRAGGRWRVSQEALRRLLDVGRGVSSQRALCR